MYILSKNSDNNLNQCHPILIQVVGDILSFVDVGVTTGYRNVEDQNKMFFQGKSQLKYPDSKHNVKPSLAVDLVIYHKDFGYLWGSRTQITDIAEKTGASTTKVRQWFFMQYARLDSMMQLSAMTKGYKLRWGGKWDNPEDLLGNEMIDVFHWEISYEPPTSST